MILEVKNKDTLVIGEFKFKCSVGRNGITKSKIEGDGKTPRGVFSLGTIYWRKDRVRKPITKLNTSVLSKNDAWCNDIKSNLYNKKISIFNKVNKEKLFRRDHKYDYLIVINYNTKRIVKNIGSAIFLHLTKDYKKTAGCVAVSLKDFKIILKLIKKNSKIKIY